LIRVKAWSTPANPPQSPQALKQPALPRRSCPWSSSLSCR